MARKHKKTKQSGRTFSLLGRKDLRTKKAKEARRGLGALLKVLAMVGVLGGIIVGLVYLNQYVVQRGETSSEPGVLKLVDAPDWVNDAIKEKIYSAAQAGGEDFKIDEQVAETVQQNIAACVPWLINVTVQATHDSLLISGQWRKPLGLVEIGKKYYIDADCVVLDYVPIVTLPIVRITGLATDPDWSGPQPGEVWEKDDLAAAIDILFRLDRMDSLVTAEKPLIFEIDSIDVSNFDGRYSRNKPHIELYAKDGTKIVWGAEIGKWSEYLEVTDTEKIGRLYNFYKQNGTLLGTAKYINLCDPQDYIFQPVDEY
jgi:hypothetical protein